jgi:hypothetical protein
MKKFFQRLFGIKKQHPAKKHKDFIECNFGMKEFNKTKRSKEFVQELNLRGKGHGKPTKTDPPPDQPPPPPPSTVTGGCIYLAFEGGIVSGTNWNLASDINCAYSGLSEDEKQPIIDAVTLAYAPYKILVTTDEAVYKTYPIGQRMRVMFTETYDWYGNGAGGVAFIGSYLWANETPCFVFTSLLGYNIKFIKEAAKHEAGHTIGLYHQAKWDANCNLISEYNYGTPGNGYTMGVGYYLPDADVTWRIGPTPYGCNNIQNDDQILTSVLGIKSSL